MTRILAAAAILFLLATWTIPVTLAHHSFPAEFDASKQGELQGHHCEGVVPKSSRSLSSRSPQQ